MLFRSMIAVNSTGRRAFYRISDYTFPQFEDSYYIVLYNSSFTNNTVVPKDVVYMSKPIAVCHIPAGKGKAEYERTLPVFIHILLPDPTTRLLVGLMVLSGITLSPFLASLKLKQKHVTINIPNILYGAMFGVGTVVNYALGFLGVIELFFLLALLITIVALVFYTGKTKETGDA